MWLRVKGEGMSERADLREAFPDRKGFSPRNLKYMRAFAAAWPDRAIVQEPLAQITWYHNLALLQKLTRDEERLWYARKAIEHGWSHNILVMQIQGRVHPCDISSGRSESPSGRRSS